MQTKVAPILRKATALLLLLSLLGLPPRVAGRDGEAEPARLTAEQAIAVALNDLAATADGYRLRQPYHEATFSSSGLHFIPRRGGPAWSWQLTRVAAGEADLAVDVGAVRPRNEQGLVVTYPRGGLVEQYLAHGRRLEQQFVIPRPLPLGGADLLIAGEVRCAGAFEALQSGWLWRTAKGTVRLGDVAVTDAAGRSLPATMQVTASETCIVVDGAALARAAYPVTVDPEIGANDFRLSDMGGDVRYDARGPAVAYNPTNNEYLVVWRGDDNTGGMVDEEFEIFGQRVDAATGAEIGGHLRLSDMGPDGNANYGVGSPAVAYNGTNNQYLVVWAGDDNSGALVDNEVEIWGQRVDAASGAEIGVDLRISDMGPDGAVNYMASMPAVAYNRTNNEYLVVWWGDDVSGQLADNEFEIFAQRVNAATGAEIGANDFRLSDMGPDGDLRYIALYPAVAYNGTNNQYLVVWSGALVFNEFEIFGQRVDAATGAQVGANDFRLSDMGPNGNPDYDASFPAVAYNHRDNEYLVVWSGDDNTGTLVDGEVEIFGQRVNAATGAQVGANDFRLSHMGPDGDVRYGGGGPAVAYNATNNEYLVVWMGDDHETPLVDDENEIFGQRVEATTGALVGASGFRLSHMGPDGDVNYRAANPKLAYNGTDNQYLVVWFGDDNRPPLVDDEDEIFGQRIEATSGAEIGANDFRLSCMGGDTQFDATDPAVAYNHTNNEYLVVWAGDDNTGGLVDDEYEIWGQRVDAATGAELGADFRISDMGPDGDARYDAYAPAVAYNGRNNQYLVVWWGDDNTGTLVDEEFEIFGQRIEAASGAEIGGDFRLSDMGPDGHTGYDALDPAVAYNGTNNEYLVVWSGDDNTGGLVNGEQEIFAQRVNAATGAEIGGDLRLSDMGPDGDVNYAASSPAVAYNGTNDHYLVVWVGDDNTFPLVNDEFEIFGQRVEAATGAQIGGDLRLSDMGPHGNTSYGATSPAVAYNGTNNEYLVVWSGDDNAGGLVNDEHEIFGQRVDAASGAEIGTDFRISQMGPDGNPSYQAMVPAVAYSTGENRYLIVWASDDNSGALVDGEYEIWGQWVAAASGAAIGGGFRLSDMGTDGDPRFGAYRPDVAYNPSNNQYLVVWRGDDDTPPLIDQENEIFGQRVATGLRLHLPLVLRRR